LSLGVVEAQCWSRDPSQPNKNAARKQTKCAEKQSGWWVRSYQRACELAKEVPDTKVVSVADREGDIYEVFVAWQEAEGPRASWVIRACQDRSLPEKEPGPGKRYRKLWAQVATGEVLGRITFRVPRQKQRAAREVSQTLQACQVELKPPARRGEKLPVVRIWAVLAREEHPPAGQEPLEWLLLTSEPVETQTAAEQIVDWYLARWQIEVFFRVLKSGCKIEQLSLREADRLECVIALYLIVAWRVLWVTALGRLGPEVPADVVFAEEEWKSVWMVVKHSKPPPAPPPLGEFVRMVASLGGYLGRKGDGPPGPQTLWTGMQSMIHYAICWLAFGPGA
jgi:IS4 transposase